LFLAGLDSEGIYRISGFADDVEALKNSFDKGNTHMIKVTHTDLVFLIILRIWM